MNRLLRADHGSARYVPGAVWLTKRIRSRDTAVTCADLSESRLVPVRYLLTCP